MPVLSVQELSFSSGSKIKYIFAQKSILDTGYPLADERTQLVDQVHSWIKQDFVRKEFSPELPRYEEFFLSRYLLSELVQDFKKRHVGGVSASLSHTQGAALVGAQATLDYEGVFFASGLGVDLEREDRKISEAVFKRLLTSKVEKTIEPLLLWALKEATFKAHPNNDKLLLSDFDVQTFKDDEANLLCSKTQSPFEAKWICTEGYLLVFARAL